MIDTHAPMEDVDVGQVGGEDQQTREKVMVQSGTI